MVKHGTFEKRAYSSLFAYRKRSRYNNIDSEHRRGKESLSKRLQVEREFLYFFRSKSTLAICILRYLSMRRKVGGR